MLYNRTLCIHPTYSSLPLLIPNSCSCTHSFTPPPPWQPQLCSLSLWVSFCFRDDFYCILDSTYKWYHIGFVFLWLTSLSVIIYSSIHNATKMAWFYSFTGWVIFHCSIAFQHTHTLWNLSLSFSLSLSLFLSLSLYRHLYIYHIFFIHFFVSRCLGCFHVLLSRLL